MTKNDRSGYFRIYLCGCGREWRWDHTDPYHRIASCAADFLKHRVVHTMETTACYIDRHTDELQAANDIMWAAQKIGEDVKTH